MTPHVNCYYQHRYGGLYMVQDIALSTVDQSKWVVYVHCYPFQYQTWIRPYDEWCDGRFRLLELNEYDLIVSSNDRAKFQDTIRATRSASKG